MLGKSSLLSWLPMYWVSVCRGLVATDLKVLLSSFDFKGKKICHWHQWTYFSTWLQELSWSSTTGHFHLSNRTLCHIFASVLGQSLYSAVPKDAHSSSLKNRDLRSCRKEGVFNKSQRWVWVLWRGDCREIWMPTELWTPAVAVKLHENSTTTHKGGCRGMGSVSFPGISNRLAGNGLKLHQGRFRLDVRKKFFSERVARY